jgi:prevent-host-death family protein
MERIGVRELNQQTSRVIERVKQGHVVEVTERGRPVARLVPVGPASGVLDRLVREGRAIAPHADRQVPMPPVIGDPTLAAADAVIAGRDDERW